MGGINPLPHRGTWVDKPIGAMSVIPFSVRVDRNTWACTVKFGVDEYRATGESPQEAREMAHAWLWGRALRFTEECTREAFRG